MAFPTMEYAVAPGGNGVGPQPFETSDKVQQLKHIFTKDQIDAMEKKLGRSIYLTHVFTELLKNRKPDQNFDQLLKLDDPAFKKIKLEYENRLNKLYSHPLLGDLLDSGEIDFALLSMLEEISRIFNKYPGGLLNPNSTEHSRDMVTDESKPLGRMFQAMLDLNLLYKSKHMDILYVEHSFYVH